MISHRQAGLGLGLRTEHYSDFLSTPQPVDWLEIVTDNYLIDGGKPLAVLDQIRADYPIVMHGVAMGLGSADGIDPAYVKRVKALAERVQPMWVSDHLCWGGWREQCLHDLYPMPYTDAAARHLIEQIRRVQDILQRRFVIENVSSYVTYRSSVTTEWDFLRHVVTEADALLLVDINNVFVSSVNHGFSATDYLDALPAERVQQMHLAGHSYQGDLIIDTHDHPICDEVWTLFAQACQRWGHVPSMIERDDDIPALPTLLAELSVARDIVTANASAQTQAVEAPHPTTINLAAQWPADTDNTWRSSQDAMALHVLTPRQAPPVDWVVANTQEDAQERAGVYRHAYRARVAEALADSFERVNLYMGSNEFAMVGKAFAVTHPPRVRSLGDYGEGLPTYLHSLYPDATVLVELAQLDWDLRKRFDSADHPALSAQDAAQLSQALERKHVLHPSCITRSISTNVVKIWQAIEDDSEVPPPHDLPEPATLLLWRHDLQPQFRTLEPGEAAFIAALASGESINEAAQRLGGTPLLPAPAQLAVWLRTWLGEGLLKHPAAA